ncbi:unnamed protein product [Nezara viridula]|uniref:Uncharacterized protein n=1 Tax=Nezara viridula TaxID=85310 RepID=A0A9P0H9M7_NEZVI|nr:unnamed protein product [Nezara viridula]
MFYSVIKFIFQRYKNKSSH